MSKIVNSYTKRSLLTFSWSSSSGFSLLFSWLLLGSSSFGSWLLFSGSGGGSWLFFLFLLSWLSLLIFSASSLVELLISFLLFWDFDFYVSLNLVPKIFSESALQHLWCFVINVDFLDLDFRLFGNPIQSSFSFFLLNFKRNTLDWTSLDSFD